MNDGGGREAKAHHGRNRRSGTNTGPSVRPNVLRHRGDSSHGSPEDVLAEPQKLSYLQATSAATSPAGVDVAAGGDGAAAGGDGAAGGGGAAAGTASDVTERFARASAAMRAAAQNVLADLTDSSSDEDVGATKENHIIGQVLSNYGMENKNNINRTIHFLEESLTSGSTACLICIGKIRNKDAIWDCQQCFTVAHLTCVQKWAKDSLAATNQTKWDCPKCRKAYGADDFPKVYKCFCNKAVDPPNDPWLLPHSCGDACGKELKPACSHRCALLCHPGPCPPCPRTVNITCHCGKSRARPVRCAQRSWGCQSKCGKILKCNVHNCKDLCHGGDCSPCVVKNVQLCMCGSQKKEGICGSAPWQCDMICYKPLHCGYHQCFKVCHAKGDCSPCPLSGLSSCPCGKMMTAVTCPDDAPLCGNTCGKVLTCEAHTCPNKCHRGQCPECVLVVEKKCRCGAHEKSMPCSRLYVCESKCRERPCGRHACGRRCCVACPACERPCGKLLSCGKHKCPSTCHRGPCYPCPLQIKVSCRCGGSYYLVNCGRKSYKTPSCNFPCRESYACGHTELNTHKCHTGECPPCKAKCGQPLENCSHRCQAVCHKYVKVVFKPTTAPATPIEVQSPRVKVMQLSCPPCSELVEVPCLGGHDTSLKACGGADGTRRQSCGRPCDRPLACGNHACAKPCHLTASEPVLLGLEEACEVCERECERERPAHCRHRCVLGTCHAQPCPPCQRPVRVQCHCGTHQWTVRCDELETASADSLSCLLRCKKTKDCGHRCSSICHPGECDSALECCKMVKVYCPCKSYKVELLCKVARSGEQIVNCTKVCEEKDIKLLQEKQEEAERLQKIEEEKNKKELELYERRFNKKGKKKSTVEAPKVDTGRNVMSMWAYAVVIVVFLALFLGYLWME